VPPAPAASVRPSRPSAYQQAQHATGRRRHSPAQPSATGDRGVAPYPQRQSERIQPGCSAPEHCRLPPSASASSPRPRPDGAGSSAPTASWSSCRLNGSCGFRWNPFGPCPHHYTGRTWERIGLFLLHALPMLKNLLRKLGKWERVVRSPNLRVRYMAGAASNYRRFSQLGLYPCPSWSRNLGPLSARGRKVLEQTPEYMRTRRIRRS
jgi:hypothetical protein